MRMGRIKVIFTFINQLINIWLIRNIGCNLITSIF